VGSRSPSPYGTQPFISLSFCPLFVRKEFLCLFFVLEETTSTMGRLHLLNSSYGVASRSGASAPFKLELGSGQPLTIDLWNPTISLLFHHFNNKCAGKVNKDTGASAPFKLHLGSGQPLTSKLWNLTTHFDKDLWARNL
jgi:hypothetical protein